MALLATSLRPLRSTWEPRLIQEAPRHRFIAPRRRGAVARPRAEAGGSGAAPATGSVVVTDATVPEGHQGLHGMLYGEDGAEAHDAPGAAYQFRKGEDDGTTLLAVPEYLESREGEKPVGVYALYSSARHLQFVGYARNVVLAVKGHLARVGEERCAFVRVMVFANRAMQSRAALQREADNWLEEAGTVPPGNGAEAELWVGSAAFDPELLSTEARAEYEEKKLKMRKAMGESLGDDSDAAALSSDERRAAMISAMESNDWSAVIDQQTQDTRGGAGASTSPTAAAQQQQQQQPCTPVTPFARPLVHREVGQAGAGKEQVDMTVEAVDRALDDVRPYLIADGGNVEVVGVEDGVVYLQLQGACGTCAASSATMKMGIERALRAAFGNQLVDVQQVGGGQEPAASVESVDMHLNMLRGAVSAYGGSVDVVAVEAGACTLSYAGPKPLAYGLQAAVKDKFPDLVKVVVLDKDSQQPLEF